MLFQKEAAFEGGFIRSEPIVIHMAKRHNNLIVFRHKPQLVRLLVLLMLLSCQACVKVQPWERGVLAKPEMSMNPNPNLTKIRDHVFSSKESSQGGHTGTGGGCGCN